PERARSSSLRTTARCSAGQTLAAEAPQIDHVAHEIECVARMTLDEAQDAARPGAIGAQMQVRDEDRAVARRPTRAAHGRSTPCPRIDMSMVESRCTVMTASPALGAGLACVVRAAG